MKLPILRALAACALAAGAAAAQPPVIEKVEPPNWWADHSINPVRLLIRGRNLGGARLECPRLACADVRVNAAVPFTVSAALPPAGRFQGFGPDDALYLLMPDRFANGDPRNDDPAAARGLLDRGQGRRYHGGDLAGVRRRLPYLKELGVTAVWMNPIY